MRAAAEGAFWPVEGLFADNATDPGPPPGTRRTDDFALAATHTDPMYRALPSFDARVYPAHKVAALVAALAEDGVPAEQALSGSGIAQARLHDTRISYQQVQTVFRNALRLSPAPALAFRAGRRMHVTSYGMYGYALLSSPNHAASIDIAVRHHRVMAPVAELGFSREGDTAVFSYEPVLVTDPTDDLYRFAMEFQFASHLTLNADLYGASFRFSEVRAVHAAPAHACQYDKLFGCPVRFDQPRNELRFDASWLAKPMDYSDPITHAMARETCERSLLEVSRAGSVAADVHRVLIEQAGRFPDIDAMAAELAMSTRTLRRRLEAEQTSYRKVLADVRLHLAVQYLRRTDMTNEEIAGRLGYSDAANFRHAFSRWTSKRPSDFRVM